MNAYLNYLLEANFGICLFALVYFLFLNKETDFNRKRIILLLAIGCSLVFPLIQFQTEVSPIPSLQYSIPTIDTPTTVIPEVTKTTPQSVTFTVWEIAGIMYLIGFMLFLGLFIIRLFRILNMVYSAPRYRYHNHTIIELKNQVSSFSFFNYIFIGTADELSETEKAQIIEHEGIHAKQYHSVDILITHLLGIVFWFNPVIRIYKKTFVQLHEFEADARAVERHDVNEYCSLLAKAALRSADLKLANYFNNSLTLKRIEMMRTLKQNIKGWKLGTIAFIIPAFFFVVACQDQVLDEVKEIAANSSMSIDYPKEVQAKIDALKAKNPGFTYIVVEPDEATGLRAENLKNKLASIDPDGINSIEIMRDIADESGNKRSFVLIEYNDNVERMIEHTKVDGVFTAVEKSADPIGGIVELKKFIAQNFDKTIPGKTYVQFTVHEDGSLSDFTITKGVSAEADREALRVAALLPKWNPGKQNGKAVKSRYVLPIGRESEISSVAVTGVAINGAIPILSVSHKTEKQGNELVISGAVKNQENLPLPGATVLIYKESKGTSTDSEGNFILRVPAHTENIVVSFIGFETKVVQL